MSAKEMRARLLAVLAEEERLGLEERGVASALSEAALEAKGQAIRALTVVATRKQEASLQCATNASKFREGDTVLLASSNGACKARIRVIGDGGRRIEVACNPSRLGGDSITMLESGEDVGAVFRIALSKLSAGAPGWWLLDILEGSDRGKRLLGRHGGETCEEMARQLCLEAGLDADARFLEALARCLGQPKLFAVQGPPGTGKTVLLALVAEGLARKGLRVAVTAHTHQAVNNALSTLHELFPPRRVCKLGGGMRRESLCDDIPCVILKDEFGNGDGNVLDTTVFGLTFASATIELSVKQGLFAPHVVLIDEAGQLPLPYASSMGLMGASSYLLFGDDRQMPPVFRTDPGANRDAVSVFARFRQHYPDYVVQLAVTHRLNDELCTAVSSVFYEEAGLPGIKPSPKAGQRRLGLEGAPNGTIGAQVVHARESLCWVDSPAGSDRETNPWEASCAIEIVEAAMAAGVQPGAVGVIVPFRRQVALVRSLLSQYIGNWDELPIVDTVERLQGMTVELIVLSATASDPDYISSVGGFLFSENRLNVAVSRARSKAIVMGSTSLWDAVPNTLIGLKGQRVWKRLRSTSFALRSYP